MALERPDNGEPVFEDPDQVDLFGDEGDKYKAEWQGMPEYSHRDLTPQKSIVVHFACLEHLRQFSRLVGQPLTVDTRSIWFPPAAIGHYANKRYADES